MKHLHFLAFALCWLVWGHLLKAQSIDHYSSLDPSQPIEFKGNCLRYADKEIILGPKTFFVDGQLSGWEWRHPKSVEDASVAPVPQSCEPHRIWTAEQFPFDLP